MFQQRQPPGNGDEPPSDFEACKSIVDFWNSVWMEVDPSSPFGSTLRGIEREVVSFLSMEPKQVKEALSATTRAMLEFQDIGKP